MDQEVQVMMFNGWFYPLIWPRWNMLKCSSWRLWWSQDLWPFCVRFLKRLSLTLRKLILLCGSWRSRGFKVLGLNWWSSLPLFEIHWGLSITSSNCLTPFAFQKMALFNLLELATSQRVVPYNSNDGTLDFSIRDDPWFHVHIYHESLALTIDDKIHKG